MSLVAQLSPLGFFMAGLAASTHCALMCGPLIAANSRTEPHNASTLPLSILQLQIGRILSYTAMGAAAGSLGAQLNLVLSAELAAFVRTTLLVAILCVLAFWLFRKPRLSHRHCPKQTPAQQAARSPLLKGMLLAWVPCPLLFTVLISCGLLASPLAAAISMACFGLAASALSAVTAFGLQYWQQRYMPYSKQVAAVVLIILALGSSWLMPQALNLWACL